MAKVAAAAASTSPVRTQKARGLIELAGLYKAGKLQRVHVPPFIVLSSEAAIENAINLRFPLYARPCPPKPTHGFIESRVVKSKTELKSLWDHVKSIEPDGEIILMKEIPALYSAVATPGRLTIGSSNDGATQGHQTVRFPLPPKKLLGGLPQKPESITDAVFLEFVTDKSHVPQLVQLRDGPAIPATTNFIPRSFEIEQVVKAGGDYRAWEEIISHLKTRSGVVIYHPGGDLTSHYAVQAVAAGIPVICSFEPKIGQRIATEKKIVVPRRSALMQGIYTGLQAQLPYEKSVIFVLSALHCVPYFDLSQPDQARIWGGACALAVRLSFTACLGEARFAGWPIQGLSRHAVYLEAWNDWSIPRKRINKAYELFANWHWGHSYGGYKWQVCAYQAILLWNAMVDLQKGQISLKQCNERMIQQVNTIVHAVHNGGWFWNKFAPAEWPAIASARPAEAAIQCMELIYMLGRSTDYKAIQMHPIAVEPPGEHALPKPPKPDKPLINGKPEFIQVRIVIPGMMRAQFRYAHSDHWTEHDWAITPEQQKAIEDAFDSPEYPTEMSLAGTQRVYIRLTYKNGIWGIKTCESFVTVCETLSMENS